MMASDRFHKAARDGILDILKEATRRDANSKDEDGMTPTLWAAFEGNLDALRLLVGRGGKPDKADNFGNTALHFAAGRGYMPCVTFLVNFGVNLWALDIDGHTPKEVSAMNGREEVLRFLDAAVAKELASDKKGVKAKQEKAKKDAEKRAKQLEKIQKKARKAAEKEEVNMRKVRKKMVTLDNTLVSTEGVMPHRPSTILLGLRRAGKTKDSVNGTNTLATSEVSASPKFSEIVNRGTNRPPTGVQKRVQQKKNQLVNGAPRRGSGGAFKIGEVEEGGKRSIRSLTGLQRDSEVIYVGSYDTQGGKRGKITDVFDTKGELNRSISQPDYLNQPQHADSGFVDDYLLHERGSIFERPGFGSVAFRNSITTTLNGIPLSNGGLESKGMKPEDRDSAHISEDRVSSAGTGRAASSRGGVNEDSSIGSAGSLAQRQRNAAQGGPEGGEVPWDEEDVASDEDDETEWSPLQLFLLASGLGGYVHKFIDERIDLEALMLLSEEDLISMGLPLGPRRKLLHAIEDRRTALTEPGEVADSHL
ncbi:pre-mRNA splicing regulator USH1G isoform X1 [Hetaerina americana]|uniref:pre-mRNA splicing regulator USH1G isoform X1 n=3 Tax=Hetaerina americana TaxID=62018 RepID=UPI003A7F2247